MPLTAVWKCNPYAARSDAEEEDPFHDRVLKSSQMPSKTGRPRTHGLYGASCARSNGRNASGLPFAFATCVGVSVFVVS